MKAPLIPEIGVISSLRSGGGNGSFRTMSDPITIIVAELVARLDAREFRPFAITLSDGARYEIPTRDHCTVTRLLRRIELEHDNGSITHINPLHITKLESREPAA